MTEGERMGARGCTNDLLQVEGIDVGREGSRCRD
jgi:hypothetical protein